MTVSLTKLQSGCSKPSRIWSWHLFLSILQHPIVARILLKQFMENLSPCYLIILDSWSNSLSLCDIFSSWPAFSQTSVILIWSETSLPWCFLSKFLPTDPTMLLGYKWPLVHADSELSPVLSLSLFSLSSWINWLLNKIFSPCFNFCPAMV